jgi:hypothetical protein
MLLISVKGNEMKVQVINKVGNIIVDIDSNESRNIATNEAIGIAYKTETFFAVYVDGKLDCFTESSDHFAFPKTFKEAA